MESASEAVVNCEKEIKEALERYNCTFKVTVTKDYSTGQETPVIHITQKPEVPKT